MATYNGTAPSELRYFGELGFAMGKRLPASADSDDALVASFHQIGLSVGKSRAATDAEAVEDYVLSLRKLAR